MNEQFPIMTDEIPQNPKIKIHLRGLGVLCFSEENNRAEIGYLDVDQVHDAEYGMMDSKKNVIIPYGSMRGKTLEILTPEKGMGKCFYKQDDSRNFNIMLDLSELYGEAAEFRENARFQSRIFINDAIFFTDPDSITTVAPFDQDSPTIQKRPMEIGEGLFAYITDENVKVMLDGKEISLKADESYTISVLSQCRHPVEGDFKHFFEILQNAGNVQYNLKHPEGANIWFTDFEKEQFSELDDQFNNLFVSNSLNEEEIGNGKMAIFSKLRHLRALFCSPEPCLKVTFANRPRSLS